MSEPPIQTTESVPPMSAITEKSLDVPLHGTQWFLLLMLPANLIIAGIASFGITPWMSLCNDVSIVYYCRKEHFFGIAVVFSLFLLILGLRKSCLLYKLRKRSLGILLGKPADSVDDWAREENTTLGQEISCANTNMLFSVVSLCLTLFVLRHFYANLPTTISSVRRFGLFSEGTLLCFLILVALISYLHMLFVEKQNRERKDNKYDDNGVV